LSRAKSFTYIQQHFLQGRMIMSAQPSSATPRSTTAAESEAIHPFSINVPEAELTELRRRINATRFPERETVSDQSQGVQLATIKKLARYWGTEYDWRKCETKLKALPHFRTEIDGLDIHSFTFVRNMKMPCRSSSRTGGRARSSSS
jgi:Epoxide hydrolase N terminus